MKWGIYSAADRMLSAEQMCDRALLAARSIKGQYGKYYALYDDKLRSSLLHDQAIADSMEDALSGDQFQIYLQPKYRIIDGALAGQKHWCAGNTRSGESSHRQILFLFLRKTDL